MAWMINLYNFMDGANGLAGGMTFIGFSVLALAADNSALACATAGAALGFLFYNFDPARVFLVTPARFHWASLPGHSVLSAS
jgi:UDP-N-acetylmuramyl pentapeptide phosphotransferase/UDP-N-acetylglucosamine-1-phosphate transferase